MLAVRRGTIVAAATSGTQTITISSFASMGEVPKGCRIWVTQAQSNATDTDEARWSDYFVDQAGNCAGSSHQSQHNQANSDADRMLRDDDTVVCIIDDAGVVKRATFGQWVAGGIEIDWTASVALGVLLHVEFIFGDEVKTQAGFASGGIVGGLPNDVTCGFKPDHIETTATITNANETATTTWHRHVAHVVRNPGSGLSCDGYFMLQEVANNSASAECNSICGSTSLVTWSFRGGALFTLGNSTSISTMLANGFRVTSSGPGPGGTTGPGFCYLAIYYGGRNRFSLVEITAPASTGTVSYETGWKPWVVKAMMLARTNTGQNSSDASGAVGWGYGDDSGTQFCASTTDDRGAATMDTQSRSENAQLLYLYTGDGTAVAYEGDIDSWDECGITIDWTAVSGSAHRIGLIFLERDHITGCGKATGPFPSASATGLAGFVGNGHAVAPFPSAFGSAILGFIGNGPDVATPHAVAPFPSAFGVGLAGFIGDAAAVAPFPTVKGFAREVFAAVHAHAVAPFPSAAGAGLAGIVGSGTAIAPFPVVAASGTVTLPTYTGDIVAVAPFPTVQGFASEMFRAAGLMRAPFPTTTAAGVVAIAYTGTITAVAPFPTASGLGTVTVATDITGSGSAVAPFPAVKGFAREVFKAAGCLRAPFPVVSGLGTPGYVGAGSAVAPFPTSAAAGALAFLGAGSAVAPFPAVSGVGFETFSGAGSAVAPFPTASGAGAESFIGNGVAQAPFPTVDGLGATDAPAIDACLEVDLAAEYDAEVSLAAEYVSEVDLVAELEGETDLAATYEAETDLDAELVSEADVTAECS